MVRAGHPLLEWGSNKTLVKFGSTREKTDLLQGHNGSELALTVSLLSILRLVRRLEIMSQKGSHSLRVDRFSVASCCTRLFQFPFLSAITSSPVWKRTKTC